MPVIVILAVYLVLLEVALVVDLFQFLLCQVLEIGSMLLVKLVVYHFMTHVRPTGMQWLLGIVIRLQLTVAHLVIN